MKKLLVFIVSLGLTAGVSAQKGYRGGFHPRPRVIIGVGAGFGAYPYYSPFYSPYGFGGYPYYMYSPRPSRLDLQIEDIRLDYADRIRSVRADKELSRKERRQRIRSLKYERDRAINDATRDYYYGRSPGY